MTKQDKLKLIKNELNLKTTKFSERVIFQKTVYILKCMGLDLGYNFTFYKYSPYSFDFANDLERCEK